DTLEYKKKQRPLKIRMLDGTVKTVMVDDSKIVSDMLMTICARIGRPPPEGITNYDEYSLVRDMGEEKKEETTGTLRKDKTLLRDDKKMEKLKQKLHTDDERGGAWSVRAPPPVPDRVSDGTSVRSQLVGPRADAAGAGRGGDRDAAAEEEVLLLRPERGLQRPRPAQPALRA
ncbi:unnamed protein product, partial [Tetraodon nigroviridis]